MRAILMTAAIVLATAAGADAAYMRNLQGRIVEVPDGAIAREQTWGYAMATEAEFRVQEEQRALAEQDRQEAAEARSRGRWRAAYFAGGGALLIGGWLLLWLYQRSRARQA